MFTNGFLQVDSTIITKGGGPVRLHGIGLGGRLKVAAEAETLAVSQS